MKLSELSLDRNLYRDNTQSSETQDSSFVSLDSSETEPTPIPSGGSAQDINTGNVTIDGAQLTPGSIPPATLDVSNWGWGQTCAFSSTDADTVSWGAGTFTSANGLSYSISAGNTGNMSAKTYIYLDLNVSNTVYQTTTTPATAVGVGKVLIAVAQNAAVSATFMLSEATQIVGDNVIANSINASKLTAGSVAVDVYLAVGSGNAIFKADATGIYLGNATFADAPFNVDMNGNINAYSLRRRDFHIFSIFESVDGYTKAVTAGSVTADGDFGAVLTAIGNNDTSSMYKSMSNNSEFSWGKNRILSFSVEFYEYKNLRGFVGMGELGIPIDLNTQVQVGFYIEGDATDIAIYGYCGNGTGHTYTSELAAVGVSGDVEDFRIEFNAGVSVEFYINDILLATITTNLPTDGMDGEETLFNAKIKSVEALASKHFSVGYWDFWQEK